MWSVTDKAALAIADIMSDRTSMPLADLLGELSRRHVRLSLEKFDEAWEDDSLELLGRVELTDPDLIVNLPVALAGHVFTHRLTEDEVQRDLLVTAPDFTAIWPLLEISPYDRLDGHPLQDDFDDDSLQAVIRLETGALAGYQAGSLISVSISLEGLHLAPAPEPDPALLAHLTSILATDCLEVFGPDLLRAQQGDLEDEPELIADTPEATGPVALEEFMTLVLVRHPEIYRSPGAPIADVLEQLGLDHDHGTVAVAGFDFQADDDARGEAEEIEMLIETYDLDTYQAGVVLAFSSKIDELHDEIHEWSDDRADDGADEDSMPAVDVQEMVELLPALSDPMVGVAIAEENLISDPHVGAVLTMILDAFGDEIPRRSLAGFTWLQGRCADVLGDMTIAEAAYTRALDLDSDHFPAMRELAAIASLRGDAGKAVSLLLRAGVTTRDPELAMLTRFAGEERADVGRNDDCWCGSGRKYKKCHLGKSDHDLFSRWEWLYHKASNWVRNSQGRDLLVELAAARVHPETNPALLISAISDPLVMDVALFEGELLADFLDERGSLLPPDEIELAAGWLSSRRALYRVENSSATGGTDLQDVVTDDLTNVREPSVGVPVGGLVCARILTIGDSSVLSPGSVAIAAADREVTSAMLALQDGDEVDPERVITVLSTKS